MLREHQKEKRYGQMTEKLICWVLLAAMVGYVWIFTSAILTQDRSSSLSMDEDLAHNEHQTHLESERFSKKVAA